MSEPDRVFTHPDFGKQVLVELDGCEVRLTFVASTEAKAASMADNLVGQLRDGCLNITLMGSPAAIEEKQRWIKSRWT